MSFEALPLDLQNQLAALKKATRLHGTSSDKAKNEVLKKLALELNLHSSELLKNNKLDIEASFSSGAPSAFLDRLTLTPDRINNMALSLETVAGLSDPVNELIEKKILENGLILQKIRAPLGLILMIFESRPNVILEAFSLAFKSGNGILLRGGSESKNTASFLYRLIDEVLEQMGFKQKPFLGLQNYDRKIVENLLHCKGQIDVVVPRGGEALIDFVQKTSLIPIIKNDRGLCHAYVDADCDLEMAINIVKNGKTQRPGVCNSLETVLVHRNVAQDFLPKLYLATEESQLQWKVDADSKKILLGKVRVELAERINWDTEYLDQILNCKIVESLDEAIDHIARHGSQHSEVIITRNEASAKKFMAEVDAAAVYWNASTRFTDGFEFGLGGELGISTQKLHVRGPVGLKELTSSRWLIFGQGQIRK